LRQQRQCCRHRLSVHLEWESLTKLIALAIGAGAIETAESDASPPLGAAQSADMKAKIMPQCNIVARLGLDMPWIPLTDAVVRQLLPW
jgi:hypothetical protein